MNSADEHEIFTQMREARAKARGYADFFSWAIDRDLEEWGVATSLSQELAIDEVNIFTNLKRRGRPNDPPDCEAVDLDEKRVAIEVTELVDREAIKAFKKGDVYAWAEWDVEKFRTSINSLAQAKALRHPLLKDGPYTGGYIVIIFTDEPNLNRENVSTWLNGFSVTSNVLEMKLFLLMSYDPAVGRYPYFEIPLQYRI